tara:strand:+ start:117 stop:347 length:231 start_codon:yes stop_codon:yes gene_type:complete
MICVGDIVVRIISEDSLPSIFGEGYFFVLDVIAVEVFDCGYLKSRPIYCCKIMNSSGTTSWIDGKSIRPVLRLNNE